MKTYVPLVRSKRLAPFLREKVREGHRVSRDPMVISGTKQEDVILISEDGAQTVPEFNTYGASVNKIKMSILKEPYTIPATVYRELQEATDIDDINRRFGDSIEKTMRIHCIHFKSREESK